MCSHVMIMMIMKKSDQPTAIQDTWHKFGYDSMTFYELIDMIDSDSPTAV